MGSRLGSAMPAAGQEAWTTMMAESPPSSMLGIMAILADVDVTSDLEMLRCPVLVVTTTGSLLGSVDAVRTWQQRIAGSELAVVDSDSYHVAAAKPDVCAQRVLAFLRKHSDS
jgi:pimeloyl-ACP methyl ester carboxylesterase